SEIKELKREEFACKEDALKAVQKWIKKHPRCLLESLDISTVSRRLNGGKGRPKKNEKLKISYLVNPKIIPNEPLIREEKKKLGRFILATNDLTLDSEQILEYYKDQNKVERGFRFLKDKSFRVSEVYLKKPERIEALSMIMVLTLFVYSTVEWILRKRLKESGEYIPNQLDKPTQKPTLKWVFMLFRGITEVKIDSSDERQIANLDEMLWKIIDLLGWCCGKYYV
ncbi:MAG: IS1634 family transposase, partial [Candidatus Syntrophoarchaeum sp.]|nr:IS1634 family transposase [Candidatus Syntrophoarchaeum sp.]